MAEVAIWRYLFADILGRSVDALRPPPLPAPA
jgi:hypothetical protein